MTATPGRRGMEGRPARRAGRRGRPRQSWGLAMPTPPSPAGQRGRRPCPEAPLCGWETGVGSHRLPSGSPAASGAPFHLRPEERTPTTRPWGQHEPSGGFGTRPPAPARPGGPPDRAARQACACPSLCCWLAPRLPDRAADAATTARRPRMAAAHRTRHVTDVTRSASRHLADKASHSLSPPGCPRLSRPAQGQGGFCVGTRDTPLCAHTRVHTHTHTHGSAARAAGSHNHTVSRPPSATRRH